MIKNVNLVLKYDNFVHFSLYKTQLQVSNVNQQPHVGIKNIISIAIVRNNIFYFDSKKIFLLMKSIISSFVIFFFGYIFPDFWFLLEIGKLLNTTSFSTKMSEMFAWSISSSFTTFHGSSFMSKTHFWVCYLLPSDFFLLSSIITS